MIKLRDSIFVIRPATPQDVPVILQLIRDLADYEKLSQEVCATESLLHQALFEQYSAEVLLGFMDHQPVGMAVFFHSCSTFLGRHGIYLEDLYVRPEFRGKGLGTSLLKEIARLAVERKCGRIEWAVLNWNTSAIEFYENLGASPLSGWTTYRLTGNALEKFALSD
ncbi:MAG: GNAT family N-acetyltransferase [SAR324 cluster bacterium]|nr:GNAT family N-acetyltransferase [SAR324 cluster bacterium]